MANTLINKELVKSSPRSVFLITGNIDTAEVDIQKIDISALEGAPSRIRINYIKFSCVSLNVRLKFDRAVAGNIAVLSGNGIITDVMEDIGTGAGTGDLLLSTLDLAASADGRGYTLEIGIEAKV